MRTLCSLIAGLALATPALAQQAPPPAAPQLHLGPVGILPRLDISELGVDSNVFNSPDDPQSDFTANIIPRVNAAARGGWIEVTGNATVGFLYFHKFTSERAINRSAEGRVEVTQGLLRPFVFGSIVDTNERLNAEIDARAHHRQPGYGGGVAIAVTTRTSILLQARRNSLDYFPGEEFRDVDLSRTMNSNVDVYETGLRFGLTPLTTWETTFGVQHDRFDNEPLRDSNSDRFMTSLVFNPSAVIQGRGGFGYRNFKPKDSELAGYSGAIWSGALTYTNGGLKLDGAFERDVRYSYQQLQPYYLMKLIRVTATQVIVGSFDVLGTFARTGMDYRALRAGTEPARIDTMRLATIGAGYRIGATARLGINAEWSRRESDLASFYTYDRRRIYGTLNYGF